MSRGTFTEWSCVVPPDQPHQVWEGCPLAPGTVVDLFVLEVSNKGALAFTTNGTPRFSFAWSPAPATGPLQRLLEAVKVGCFLQVQQGWPPLEARSVGGGTITPEAVPTGLAGVQVPLRLEEAVCYAQLDNAGTLTYPTFSAWALTPAGRWIALATGVSAPVRVERAGALYQRLYVQVTGGAGPGDLYKEVVPLQRESANPGVTVRLGAVIKGAGA